MTIDPVLNGDPAPLVVVPLPHQGRVAGTTGAGSARLVRSSTTKGRSQLQQEREVRKRPRSLDGHPVRAGKRGRCNRQNQQRTWDTLCTTGNPLDPLCRKRSRQFWAGSRPPCCVSHRGTYSPKYHWLSQYHVRARGRLLTESTKSSRLLAGGVRRHMLYHLPAVPLPQHLQDENIYSSYTRLWGLWLTLLVVGISEGKLNRHHKGTFLDFLDLLFHV